MDTKLLKFAEKAQIRKDYPQFEVGDTIAVESILREKGKQRTQTFKGIVIAIKGSGLRKMFTIRKISMGVGVEKIYPLHSPNINKITFLKKGKIRRSKLYYMRGRIGKLATKIVEGEMSDGMKKQHKKLVDDAKKAADEAAAKVAAEAKAKADAEAEAKKAEEAAKAAEAKAQAEAAQAETTEAPADETPKTE